MATRRTKSVVYLTNFMGESLTDLWDFTMQVQKVEVTTTFKLYVLDVDRSKKAKKVWLAISPPDPLLIDITASPKEKATTYDEFNTLVTTRCEAAVKNTGQILTDGLTTGSPEIGWFVSIARVEGFKKGKPFLLSDVVAYNSWMEALVKVEADESNLSIEMVSPNKVAKLQHDAEVLAKDAIRKEAKRLITLRRQEKKAQEADGRKRKQSDETDDSEEEVSDEEEEFDKDSIKLFMRQLYATHMANAMYDRHIPVYIHPTEQSKFFRLSNATCQKWARALAKAQPGVSIQSPPKEFKFEVLPLKQLVPPVKNVTAANECTHHNRGRDASPLLQVGSDGPQPGEEVPILDYLNFIGLKNAAEVGDVLERNDLQNYKIFRSSNLDRPALRGLGLTLGVVTQLCDCVSKFERHLANQEANRG
ncbi:hypothetical protein PGT21_032597 [Puccinia graminis f. sp. tritici]|uniref:Uncharacterized protein n=1 Tax=Puccinia graminis f. sp. tritici TaxID=56615 RepID=A0A5B0PZE0_PUCGR|nr:hypothetical protein PGT21_032597 [Puccinia graminis f. sp. tritici]KAA1109340.1 hypothetical protein PGTUg99_029425 [Puccinia graminis f. sp. tritici]